MHKKIFLTVAAFAICVAAILFTAACNGDADQDEPLYLQIIFTTEEGQTVSTFTDTSAEFPKAPEKTGYRFEGWYLDQEGSVPFEAPYLRYWNATTVLQVYAKFSVVDYVITYDFGEGIPPVTDTYRFTDAVELLIPATPEGYTFAGWRVNGSGVIIKRIEAESADLDLWLTPVFTPNLYRLTIQQNIEEAGEIFLTGYDCCSANGTVEQTEWLVARTNKGIVGSAGSRGRQKFQRTKNSGFIIPPAT